MTHGINELSRSSLVAELKRVLQPRLASVLRGRGAGHCMYVTDIDDDLMLDLCRSLRADVPESQIYILSLSPARNGDAGLVATGTKLVELRNPLPDQTQRPPLLVFLPNNLRTTAEDSFNIATFEHIIVNDSYEQLITLLRGELPLDLRAPVADILQTLKERRWKWMTPLHIIRFLLTIKENDNDPATVGAALFELGLIPDFNLMSDLARIRYHVDRNLLAVQSLTGSGKSERGRVVGLGLKNPEFRKRLSDFLVETGLEDPRQWTRKIVLDKENWQLNFSKWEFEDGNRIPEEIFINVTKTTLPFVKDDEASARLQELVGNQILPLGDQNFTKFSVEFRTHPQPTKVQGLAKFVAQIVSKESGTVGVKKAKSLSRNTSSQLSINFTGLNRVELEEGWHYVRVIAVTADGDPIPLVDDKGRPVLYVGMGEDEIRARQPNESEPFYVLPSGDIEVEPLQRSVPKFKSLEHARVEFEFDAIKNGKDPHALKPEIIGWKSQPTRQAYGPDVVEVRFGHAGTAQIPVTNALKAVEGKILNNPGIAYSWQMPIRVGIAQEPLEIYREWPTSTIARTFIDARQRYFEKVRGKAGDMLSQVADFRGLKGELVQYASAYRELLMSLQHTAESSSGRAQQKHLSELRDMLAIDTIHIQIVDHRGSLREAGIVSPTHPLHALWLAAWSELCALWIEQSLASPDVYADSTRQALLHGLSPLNFPPVMPFSQNRLFIAVDTIHPYWTLYAPSKENDPRGLVGEVSAAVGLTEAGIGGATITGEYVATRIQRYLLQHPYVRTLTLNTFNPGRASLIRDALLELQKIPAFKSINYDIRLFVSDPDAPGVGEALTQLLTPEGGVITEEADAFLSPTGNHLFPKLSLAIRSINGFRQHSAAYKAHMSMLFDPFPPEEVGAALPFDVETSAPVHGLFQDFISIYQENKDSVVWRKQPSHGVAQMLRGAEDLSDLLAILPRTISTSTALVATGETGLNLRPVITLALAPSERTLIHQVHDVSDWVITIDRNMGIEFYDHGGSHGRPDYIIDHSPDIASTIGHKLVITSRSLSEIEALLRPTLEQYGLMAEGEQAATILGQLRSLSGRLALKFISSSSQRAEALGLALARLYLGYQGALADQIIVPLDAHLDLYKMIYKSTDDSANEVNFKRTDLALFDLNAGERTITCNLVEVKCYSQVGGLGAYRQLKSGIVEQVNQSERVLRLHFDPRRTEIDRPDRLYKTRELVTLLDFYLKRGIRYGLIKEDVSEEARFFLGTLEEGYGLKFTKSAIVFDFEKPGTDPPEHEDGIEYHRIGINLIKTLVEVAAAARTTLSSLDEDESISLDNPAALLATVPDLPVPKVTSAAFVVPQRDRTISWEKLNARRILGDDVTNETDGEHLATKVQIPIEDVGGSLSDIAVEDIQGLDVIQKPDEISPASLEGNINTTEETVDTDFNRIEKAPSELRYDVLLGSTEDSPQYGILGETSGRKVALDLNQTHTISLFGVQGGGKSYTLGTIVEMATMPIQNINLLPGPLATVIFHYSPTQDYSPEFTSMISANNETAQIKSLKERYGAAPQALNDVLLLTSEDKLGTRREEFPGIDVQPLKFSAAELQANHWRFLMGAVGSQSMYLRQVNMVMRTLRNNLTLEGIREGIANSSLSDHLKELARMRLELAAQYIDDSSNLTSMIRPGRLIIVDIRDEFIEKDEALGLFVVLLQLFSEAKHEGRAFNKLVVFDEAHKYIENPELVSGLIEVVREMRHKGTSILVASQDPPSVPVSLIELSSHIILHKFNSPAWLKHIQKANSALGGLTAEKMSHLSSGEAYVWSSKATDTVFSNSAVKIICRPRITRHGGGTKTALPDDQ
jgi:DNA phosphorothioation-dependent restriction protein DptH